MSVKLPILGQVKSNLFEKYIVDSDNWGRFSTYNSLHAGYTQYMIQLKHLDRLANIKENKLHSCIAGYS